MSSQFRDVTAATFATTAVFYSALALASWWLIFDHRDGPTVAALIVVATSTGAYLIDSPVKHTLIDDRLIEERWHRRRELNLAHVELVTALEPFRASKWLVVQTPEESMEIIATRESEHFRADLIKALRRCNTEFEVSEVARKHLPPQQP